MLSLYSRGARPDKRCAAAFLFAAFACAVSVQTASAHAVLMGVDKTVTIRRASQIVLSHTGIHTHANFLLFDTGPYDLLAMQHDPVRYPGLSFRAHSSLPTDHAALPPDLAIYSAPGDPPLDNPYGPIDGGHGKPGWLALPLHQNGRNFVKVLAATRFANWLALQPRGRQKQYLMPQHYTLVISWRMGIPSPTGH